MAQQKKSFITRMLEGKEKSEEYARSTLPTNRWQLFWDIFKGNFGKMVKVNLLVFLFCIPTILVIFFSSGMDDSNGIMYPFGANLGVGYPSLPDLTGVSESIHMQSEIMMFGGISISMLIACVGISGGMYVVRNMVWTEGIFVANDFWKGVKKNYKVALQSTLFFCLVLLLGKFLINMTDFTLAVSEVGKARKIWLTVSKVFSIGLIIFAAFMAFWMLALGLNYEQKTFTLFKNSVLMSVGMFPQTVFFGLIALLPFLLFMLGDFFMIIAVIILILFGFSFALLVWINFSQWAFDKFINPKIGVETNKGIWNKDGTKDRPEFESGAMLEYKRTLLAAGKSDLVARPIKPIDDSLQVYELPSSFTRDDLKKLRDSKQHIAEDTKEYEELHKNDLRYVEYNKQFEERERALQDADDKKKKRKPPKMLGR